MLDEDFLKLVREAFAIEADELLRAMTIGLQELEVAPAPARRKDVVEKLFRDAHSLKGAAGTVSRGDIESVSRGLESIFAQWKTSDVTAPPETFELLNRAVDLLGNLLQHPNTDIDPGDSVRVTRMIHELAASISASH